MKTTPKSVPAYLRNAYLTNLPPQHRVAFSVLRKLIIQAVPDAKESMHHGMWAYTVGDCPLFGLASRKHYLTLYVCAWDAMNKYRSKLGNKNCGKGCVRFKKLEDLPLDVVQELLEEAVEEVRTSA